MFELSGQILNLLTDFRTGKATITLAVNEKQDAMNMFDELHDAEKLSFKISKYRKKRSLDANAYFWVLCGKLAAKTKQDKIELYRELIRSIGDNFEILPIRNEAVEKFVLNWGRNDDGKKRLGWVCDILGESKLEGYTNVCAYYGSSTYDSKQMSDLIDNIIFECKEQGIQTETPEQIAKMKSLWGEEYEKHNPKG